VITISLEKYPHPIWAPATDIQNMTGILDQIRTWRCNPWKRERRKPAD
jgi:hypothetical protein